MENICKKGKNMKVMVVSPHPDDETLGAGGTLLRLKKEGHQIYWLNITDAKEKDGWSASFIKQRKEQIQRVCDFFEFDYTFNLKFPPAKLEMLEKSILIQKIGSCFQTVEPEWIILPDPNDAHSDHKITYESCISCSKIFRYPYIHRITTMEILSETDFGRIDNPFVPNYFVNISDYMKSKIQALEIYDTELGEHPFPRSVDSVKALGTLRGACAGVKYAEAFRIIKWIE